MKAEELRIGNWYNSVKWQRPVILDITDIAELYHRCDGAYDNIPVDEMIEPIPLTEEWLLKFWFSCYKKNRYGQDVYYDPYFRFMIIKDGNNWMFFAFNELDGGEWFLRNLEYVHQLQNLYFALTNTELEINK